MVTAKNRVASKNSEREISEAEIDRNLADSFPASDPPSWTLGVDHKKEPSSADHSEKQSAVDDSQQSEKKD